jgi:hypothetical protein
MGIFVSRGMTISIPPGGLTLGPGAAGSVTVHVRFDVCPTWTELALRHLQNAKEKRAAREIAWAGTNADEKAAALEREFEASMQAIMAAAIALDAFYSMVKGHVALPQSLTEKWRKGRTARYSQVTEVLRRAFHLKPKVATGLRKNLKQIYKLRDLAVHPSGKLEAPLLHPELYVGIEWRFVYFRAHDAELVVNAATWILWDLAHGGKPTDTKILEYMGSMRERLAALFPNGHPTAAIVTTPPVGQH